MGAIIRLESKKFLKDFMPKEDFKKFEFILISDFITTRKEFKNVMAIPKLIPPPGVVAQYIDGNKEVYKKSYLQYLQIPDHDAMVAIIVKAAVINDMNLVLVCSRSESEFKYLNYLCEYIEAAYKLKTFSYKDFAKDTEKNSVIKNKDEVVKILSKRVERMEKEGLTLDPEKNKEKYIKQLKKLGRKGMKKLAKSKGIKLKDDMDKTEMAKKIVKKLLA